MTFVIGIKNSSHFGERMPIFTKVRMTRKRKCFFATPHVTPMSKEQTKDLLKFLRPFSAEVNEIVLSLREFVWDLYPQANELLYDNYNAVAFGWSPTEKVGHTFCSIAVGRTSKNIHFGFYWGAEINDPKKLLIGQGNQYRYILVGDMKTFPRAYIKKLMAEAYDNSLAKVKDKEQIRNGLTITKSVSEKKRALKKKANMPVKKSALRRKKTAAKKKRM